MIERESGGGSGEPYVRAFGSPQPLGLPGRLTFSGGGRGRADAHGSLPAQGGVADPAGNS